MTANSGVTIYHFSPDNGYVRSFFEKASVFKTSDLIKIRIPTRLYTHLACGDYVFLGKSDNIVPQKEKCFMIKEYSDNRRGVNPHWRILAG